MALDDVADVDNSASMSPDVSQEALDNVSNFFADHEIAAKAEVEAAPADPPRDPAALRAAAKEQREELEEEGLDSDGLGQHIKAEVEAAPDEDEAPAEDAPVDKTEEAVSLDALIDPGLAAIARENGWDDASMRAFIEANPDAANTVFNKLADAFNGESQQYLATPQQQAPQANLAPHPASSLDELFKPESLKAFAEANGQDIVDKLLKPLQQELQGLRQVQAHFAAQERNSIAAEATTAYDKLSDKYADVYGTPQAQSTLQKYARGQVAQLADQLRSGAKLQGRDLSVAQAINRAHLIVTADRRQADGRKQVTEQVQKRSKSITNKPTARRTPNEVTGKRTDTGAMEAYESKAAALGIEVG